MNVCIVLDCVALDKPCLSCQSLCHHMRAHREGRRASAVGTEEDAAAAIAALEAAQVDDAAQPEAAASANAEATSS